MPELPEVETVVRDLRPCLVGRRVTALRVGKKSLRRKWSAAWKKQIVGRCVQAIERRGKWILLDLDGPWLLVHLGMTGQFVVAAADEPRQNHTHLVFTLEGGGHELRFRDIRRFGSAAYHPTRADIDAYLAKQRLGPEPFDVDPQYWRGALAKTRRNLKAILLDQRVVAGVGNIYADESCFEARLHPTTLGCDLTSRQANRLRESVQTVLHRAIDRRGSSIRNYIGGSGLMGQYQEEFRVYGRTGEPCLRCRTPIERIVLAGRATHFCPQCQLPGQRAERRKPPGRASVVLENS
ncbi:MAG TPA: bifunctional DNA-formamidopyrimidine glycosylase/DNA-(apurinic or apyrimidinic site) lyase [Candidatus Cybelea sp.]|nr:bifunctional DNA-formamidopyrimidine glycosylase/DNA-(apurinic or apyrimidinic site) lyase [Candidatus Cybelea sp.]